MTAMAFFELLYLVLGPRQFAPFVTIPYASTPPPIRLQLLLDFRVFSPNFVSGLGPNLCSDSKLAGFSIHQASFSFARP